MDDLLDGFHRLSEVSGTVRHQRTSARSACSRGPFGASRYFSLHSLPYEARFRLKQNPSEDGGLVANYVVPPHHRSVVFGAVSGHLEGFSGVGGAI